MNQTEKETPTPPSTKERIGEDVRRKIADIKAAPKVKQSDIDEAVHAGDAEKLREVFVKIHKALLGDDAELDPVYGDVNTDTGKSGMLISQLENFLEKAKKEGRANIVITFSIGGIKLSVNEDGTVDKEFIKIPESMKGEIQEKWGAMA